MNSTLQLDDRAYLKAAALDLAKQLQESQQREKEQRHRIIDLEEKVAYLVTQLAKANAKTD